MVQRRRTEQLRCVWSTSQFQECWSLSLCTRVVTHIMYHGQDFFLVTITLTYMAITWDDSPHAVSIRADWKAMHTSLSVWGAQTNLTSLVYNAKLLFAVIKVKKKREKKLELHLLFFSRQRGVEWCGQHYHSQSKPGSFSGYETTFYCPPQTLSLSLSLSLSHTHTHTHTWMQMQWFLTYE